MEEYFNIYVHPRFKDVNFRFFNEEFKPIPEYEGLYSVSNFGRVKSESRPRWAGSGYAQLESRINGHFLESHGYYSTHLWKNNIHKRCLIHRLVAITFLEGPPSETVNHKDGIKINNFVSNLEWASYLENNRHAFEHGLMNPVKGIDNVWAKLTDEKVREIRRLLACGISQRKIANMFGVSRGPIQRISENKGWKHVK